MHPVERKSPTRGLGCSSFLRIRCGLVWHTSIWLWDPIIPAVYRVFGFFLLIALNIRYFIEGPPAAIAFFVGIYDIFYNIGLGNDTAADLSTCPGNACSVWNHSYTQHPAWGVAFYERFANGPYSRTKLLYLHIACNTIALLMMHYQLTRPPGTMGAKDRRHHQQLGRFSFGALTAGTIFAVCLASQHGSIDAYGGILSQLGFYSMSIVVYGSAVAAVLAARRGDIEKHRIWSIRALGSMWGAFWLFRLMIIVTGPLLRNWKTTSVLFSIWTSAPLGVLIAEALRRGGIIIIITTS